MHVYQLISLKVPHPLTHLHKTHNAAQTFWGNSCSDNFHEVLFEGRIQLPLERWRTPRRFIDSNGRFNDQLIIKKIKQTFDFNISRFPRSFSRRYLYVWWRDTRSICWSRRNPSSRTLVWRTPLRKWSGRFPYVWNRTGGNYSGNRICHNAK